MLPLLVAYALSGFIALGYQVIWFRTLIDAVGATPVSFAIVVTGFIGGLAAGGLASSAVVRQVSRLPGYGHPLRAYGLIEFLIVGAMLLTRWMVDALWTMGDPWPYTLVNGIWEPVAGLTARQLGTGIASVFLPCFFMGTTFPLLAGFVPRGVRGQWPSALYAANTLGAALGVLACHFLLLRSLGAPVTLGLLALLNALLGAAFLAFGPRLQSAERGSEKPRAAASSTSDAVELVLLATVTGFAAGALEGDLFRRVTFIVEMNPAATAAFVSFWCVAAIFVASVVANRFPGISRRQVGLALVGAVAVHQLAWAFVDPLVDFIEATFTLTPIAPGITLEGTRSLIFPANMVQLLVFTGVLCFMPYLLCSVGLPIACDRLKAAGHSVDLAYGLNALAFCIGLLAFTVGAPQVNIFYALKLFPIVALLLATWIIAWHRGPRWGTAQNRILSGAVGISLLVAVVAVPREFDPRYFRDDSGPAHLPVRGVASDGVHTTFLTVDQDIRRLYFGRLSMSSDNYASQVYMRLMAHFPLLAHPEPRRALLICFGVGNTASAIAAHPGIEQLDIVDLNPRVFATAGEFPANRGVAGDARVRLVHDDGRQFLRRPGPAYDLITSEPPPPLAAGVDRLYSAEYYASVKARLTPNGLMTQWLPLHLLSPEATAYLVETFTASFPHVHVFTGFGTDFVLVGSLAPIDLANLEQRFPAPGALQQELARIGVKTPTALIARVVAGDRELRERYRGGRIVTDERNDLEQLLPRPGVRPVIAYDPRRVWAEIGAAPFRQPEEIREVLMHLGRLRYHVQNFPFDSLATVPEAGEPPVALAGVDWNLVGEYFRRQLARSAAGENVDMAAYLEQYLAVTPELPEVLLPLAGYRLREGRLAEAELLLHRFLAIEPGDPAGMRLLARLQSAQAGKSGPRPPTGPRP